jgi:hypothetical protein
MDRGISTGITVGDVLAALLEFIRANGPIGAVAAMMGVIALLLAAFYLVMKIATRLPGRESFDVGKTFNHFYKSILPAASAGVVWLIYAAYGALVLSYAPARQDFRWLHQPFDSLLAGVVATLIVGGIAAKGFADLAKALWFALHWIALEARGLTSHKADNGEQYRVLWRRRSGELFSDKTDRYQRLEEERAARHARRQKLLAELALAALSILAWLYGPALFKSFYPLFPVGTVAFFGKWNVPALIGWLILLFAAIPKTVASIAALLDELFYRAGFQFVTGAKVIDPRPTPLGRGAVDNQKVHGDADFESADQAVWRMSGKRRS